LMDVMPIPYADLAITDFQVPPTGASGRTISVSWTIANQGIGATSVDQWNDSLQLTSDADGKNTVGFAQLVNHSGTLAPNGSYTHTADFTIPPAISGTFYLKLTTNVGGVFEFIHNDNNSQVSGPITVSAKPTSDLTVTNVTIPSAANAGDTIDITWTVQNIGGTDTDQPIFDNVLIGPADGSAAPTVLGTYQYASSVQAGKSYTRTEQFKLPAHQSGAFRVFVTTNVPMPERAITFEGGATSNNTRGSTGTLTVTMQPLPDLQVSGMVIPTTATSGGTLSVDFTVINQGDVQTTTPHWHDSVYLSGDNKFSGDDTFLGSIANPNALAHGESYTSHITGLVVPLRFSGPMYVFVVADDGNAVDEFPNDGNN